MKRQRIILKIIIKKLDCANNQYSNLLLEYNQSKNKLMEVKDELSKTKDKLGKEKNSSKKEHTKKIKEIEKDIKYKNDGVINLKNELIKKNKYTKDLEETIEEELKKELSSSKKVWLIKKIILTCLF